MELPKLCLGTAQFSGNYGISNRHRQMRHQRAKSIIQTAIGEGIFRFETARVYGKGEEILGESTAHFQKRMIIAKTPVISTDFVTHYDKESFKEACYLSLEKFKADSIEALLVHHGHNILLPGGDNLVEALKELKREKVIRKLGVSVYSQKEIEEILRVFVPDLIQLPFNAADRRLEKSGCLSKLKSLGVEVHARSIFLQGLLLMDINEIPRRFGKMIPEIRKFQERAFSQGYTLIEACLSQVLKIKEIDVLLFGVNTPSELVEITECYRRVVKKVGFKGFEFSSELGEEILDPRKWETI